VGHVFVFSAPLAIQSRNLFKMPDFSDCGGDKLLSDTDFASLFLVAGLFFILPLLNPDKPEKLKVN